jgi:NRAMP (natural resistance-associated macrophage protein)-like metal ion transporter
MITAVVDNDASGVASYSVVGAKFGYSMLWILLISTLSLAVIQEMSARLGIVTGKGLTDLIRENYGVQIAFFAMSIHFLTCWTTAISEIAGIAASMELLGVNRYVSVPLIGALLWILILKGNYRTAERVFLWLTIFYFSYVVSAYLVKPDWSVVIKSTFIPDFHPEFDYIYLAIAIIGTTITPWMQYYLQSAVVDKGIRIEHLKYERLEVYLGAFVTDFFAFFIIVATGATLYLHGIEINSAEEAALALKPLAGEYCFILFALGFLNASLLGATILPLASAYAVCEFFGWESGLNKKLEEAPHFYYIFTGVLALSILVVLIPGFPLIKVMVFSQVVNGILLPVVLFLMLKLVNNKKLMGKRANNFTQNLIAWTTVSVLIILTILMLVFPFFE